MRSRARWACWRASPLRPRSAGRRRHRGAAAAVPRLPRGVRRAAHGTDRCRGVRGLPGDIGRPRGVARRSDQPDVFSGSVRSFRLSAVLCALVPLAVALLTAPAGLGSSVGVVFVVAASTLSPVVLLGVWWRGLTARGAVAGMLSGGLAAGHRAARACPDRWRRGGGAVPRPARRLDHSPRDGGDRRGLDLDPRGPSPRTERFLARVHTPERG